MSKTIARLFDIGYSVGMLAMLWDITSEEVQDCIRKHKGTVRYYDKD